NQSRYQAINRDSAKAGFLSKIVLQVEIDANKTTVAAFAIVNGRSRREKISVIVLLESGIHVGLAGCDLDQPVVVFVFLVEIEPLHVGGCAQLMICAQVG